MTMSALVARLKVEDLEYLAPNHGWVKHPSQAAVFESSREATRQALRLPSGLRAFALPSAGQYGNA